MQSARSAISCALDMVAEQMGLPVIPDAIKSSSLKLSTKRGADLLLMLTHPDWSEWRNQMPAAAHSLTLACHKIQNNNDKHQLLISACEPVTNPLNSIALTFDRSRSVPQILKRHQDYAALPLPISSDGKDEKYIVISVKTPDRKWISRRVDILASTVRRAVSLSSGQEADLQEIVSNIDVQEDEKAANVFEGIKLLLPNAQNEQEAVEIDASSLTNSDLKSCSFILRPQSNVIPAIVRLREILLPLDSDASIILIAHRSLVSAYRRAVAVLCLTGDYPLLSDHISIITVEDVRCDQDPDDFAVWLKNMIIAQSVSEDFGASGDTPVVPMDTVLKLFQTCIQFMLLSKPTDHCLSVDHSSIRGFLFVQYNVSRLHALIEQFEISHPDHESRQADHSLLTSDLEWDIVFKYVRLFEELEIDAATCASGIAFRDITSYVMPFIRDLSE